MYLCSKCSCVTMETKEIPNGCPHLREIPPSEYFMAQDGMTMPFYVTFIALSLVLDGHTHKMLVYALKNYSSVCLCFIELISSQSARPCDHHGCSFMLALNPFAVLAHRYLCAVSINWESLKQCILWGPTCTGQTLTNSLGQRHTHVLPSRTCRLG